MLSAYQQLSSFQTNLQSVDISNDLLFQLDRFALFNSFHNIFNQLVQLNDLFHQLFTVTLFQLNQ